MKFLVLFLTLCFFYSCDSASKHVPVDAQKSDSTLKKYVEHSWFFYHNYRASDTLILGFVKNASEYDTSWNLEIWRTENAIRGNYNYRLPKFETGFEGYIDDSIRLMHYEGFTFEMPKAYWDSLINLDDIRAYTPKDTTVYFGCFHCPQYIFYCDSKLIVSGREDYNFLSAIDRYFKKNLLEDFFKKKKNPFIKTESSRP